MHRRGAYGSITVQPAVRAPVQLKPVQLGDSSLLLPIKRAIRRAPQSHYPSPAALVVKALARDGLPQADQLRPLVGDDLLDHLGGSLLDFLLNLGGHLLDLFGHLRSDLGVDALCLRHTCPTLSPPSLRRRIATYTLRAWHQPSPCA